MHLTSKKLDTNIYSYLLLRIALLLVLFTISRAVFILWNQELLKMSSEQIQRAMLGGLIFDVSGILYVNLLLILLCLVPFDFRHRPIYQRILHWIFVIFNAIGLSSNMGDVNYFPFTLKRTTSAVFEEFAHEARLGIGLGEAIFQFLPTFLIWVGMVIILFQFSLRVISSKPIFSKWYWNSLLGLILGAAFIGLTVAGIRGGFRHSTRPITLANAAKYIDKPIHRAAVLNTPFSVIRSLGKKPISRKKFFPEDTSLTAIYDPTHFTSAGDTTERIDNVMILVLESFAREHIGALNRDIPGYKGYTPFLDSLVEYAFVFERAFANGRKSIDALPAVISGIPKLERPFVLSHNSNNDIESLASLLRQKGYASAFFHGAPNGSMGLDAFIKQAKFDYYYGMNEYEIDQGNAHNDFDGLWGLWDEPFFQYAANQLDTLQKPFVAGLFSLSSHHPFKVPDEYSDSFPKGEIPLHEPIGYTDNALRKFFDQIKTKDWYSSTLFIITCDHAAGTNIPKYNTMTGYFAAPMILYHPSDTSLIGRNDTAVVQHIDIMPTVLSYLNYNRPYLSFGADMMDPEDDHFAFNGTNGIYQLIEGDLCIHHDEDSVLAIYNYINDPLLVQNLIDVDFEEKEYLIAKVQAVIQQISNRMIDNELVLR